MLFLSGLKVNCNKTRAVWIGCKKSNGEAFNHRYKLNWDQSDYRYLGLTFSCDMKRMVMTYYENKVKEIELELEQWSKRMLAPLVQTNIGNYIQNEGIKVHIKVSFRDVIFLLKKL